MKIFLAINLLAVLAFGCGCGGNVEKVKSSSLPMNRALMLGKVFDAALVKAKWTEIETEKGAAVVCVEGDVNPSNADLMQFFPVNIVTGNVSSEVLKELATKYPNKGESYFSCVGIGMDGKDKFIAPGIAVNAKAIGKRYNMNEVNGAIASATKRIDDFGKEFSMKSLSGTGTKAKAYDDFIKMYHVENMKDLVLRGQGFRKGQGDFRLPGEATFDENDLDRGAKQALLQVEQALFSLANIVSPRDSDGLPSTSIVTTGDKLKAAVAALNAKSAAALEACRKARDEAARLHDNASLGADKAIADFTMNEKEALSKKYPFNMEDTVPIFSFGTSAAISLPGLHRISPTPAAYSFYGKEAIDAAVEEANKRISSEWNRGLGETDKMPPHIKAFFVLSADATFFQPSAVIYSRGKWEFKDEGLFTSRFYSILLK